MGLHNSKNITCDVEKSVEFCPPSRSGRNRHAGHMNRRCDACGVNNPRLQKCFACGSYVCSECAAYFSHPAYLVQLARCQRCKNHESYGENDLLNPVMVATNHLTKLILY